MKREEFRGFPAGKLRATSIPDLFFAELLPAIRDLAELRVTLHVFWLAQQKARKVKAISFAELRNDPGLMTPLKAQSEDANSTLRVALDAAVRRGMLLRLRLRADQGDVDWFLLNTESGRETLDRVENGDVELGGVPLPEEQAEEAGLPNIFSLYEGNIGLLQPLIVQELEDAEKLYPVEWIEEAFKIAVESNVRKWRYIRAILERWRTEGKDDERSARDGAEDGRNYLKSKYADSIKH